MNTHKLSHYLCAGLCILFSVIAAIALYFYDPHDPSWFFTSSAQAMPHNLLGAFGANLAGVLLYLFGAAAFILCLLLFFTAYYILWGQPWQDEFDRFAAGGLLMLASCALLNGYALDPVYTVAPGGVVGNWVNGNLQLWADPLVAGFFLHVVIFASLVLLTRLSWIMLARYVAYGTTFVINKKTIAASARGISWAWGHITRPVLAAGHWVWRKLSGADIETGQRIVPLEFDQVVDEVLRDAQDDLFWRKAYGGTQQEQQLNDIQQSIASPSPIAPRVAKPTLRTSSVRDTQSEYVVPDPALFASPPAEKQSVDEEKMHEQRARILEQKLARFGVMGKVVSIKSGPVITLFEYEPDIDSKVSKIIALEDDLALALEAVSIRIIAPIPGRSVVGFEVANKKSKTVYFQSIVKSKTYAQTVNWLPLVLGSDITGKPVVVDLASMPHLLVAGSTGSGKSVALNAMLMSLLYRCTPDELQLILIDPKRLEFAVYADIGHLVFPIVTDPKGAAPVLQWVVKTMEERYETMASVGARNLFDYQALCATRDDLTPMPFLVIMIDELSDLMMTAGKEIEALIARIAQMARAAGIHMIVATQRPSVDVITGLIKVNFPSRISFRVTSKVDSRTILDCVGAEKLLGNGDMLFLSTASALARVHGAYISHNEISQLVEYIKQQQPVNYLDIKEELPAKKGFLLDADDELYDKVIDFIKSTDQISISLLQRRFRIGYNRSARIMEMLEAEGLIMPSDGSKMRSVVR